jgi:hypothetical protein
MPAAPASSAFSAFTDTYHLWSVIILLCVMGIYHLAGLLLHWGFRLCGDAHEEYYAFKVRCAENRDRFSKTVGERRLT